MRRSYVVGVAAAVASVGATLLAPTPASAAEILSVPGVCYASLHADITDKGLTAYTRTQAASGCTVSVTASCETYTGASVSISAGPLPAVWARLRGAPAPTDLTNCTVRFDLDDPASGANQYSTQYFNKG